jgi:hypothetical protein
MMTFDEAIGRAVEIANQAGLRGRRVRILIVPPDTATSDYVFVIVPLPCSGASEG